ncbi:hypothetical protein [Mycolicibacterium wolinskyi]|nr:hypothetical protein [Mycolicibacterium wolinskyi]
MTTAQMRAERNTGPMTYRLHVVAADAADVAAHAAGMIVDRVMGGWRVTVSLTHAGDARPLQILGAEFVEAEENIAGPDGDRCVLAIDADLYSHVAQEDNHQLLSRSAEVLIWGKPAEPERAVSHRLSAAGRAFKAEALAAAGVADHEVGWTEVFEVAGPPAAFATLHA